MKIRVAFIDSDSNYIDRVKTKFRKDYAEEIEASYYSAISTFIENYDKNKANIAVVNTTFQGDSSLGRIPCPILYLSEDNSEGKIGDYPVTGKYQRMEEIYRHIISLYSDSATSLGGFIPASSGGKKIVAFVSPAGGTGSSTMAIACAERLAKLGRSVMYLNLEKLAFYYYSGNNGGFEDLMFTLKENKSNLSLKIESLARKSMSGVTFLPGIKNALDMGGLDGEDIQNLIKAISRIESVQDLVIDMDFTLSKDTYDILDKATYIVMTTDGSEMANAKTQMALNCLGIVEGKYQIMSKIRLVYNRFSAGSFCSKLTTDIPDLGTVNRYKASSVQIIEAIGGLDIFDTLV